MTTKATEDWLQALRPRLERRGGSWEQLAHGCQQVILFGSRAAGVGSEDSDFDLLCIGTGASRLGPSLDLVFVTPEDRLGQRWLGSELAGHVARYGIWLQGEPDWAHRVITSRPAIERKEQKLLQRLQSVEEHFARLDSAYLQKYFDLTRRDLQRHEYLVNGEPVPPTPILDRSWEEVANPEAYLHRLASAARADSKFFLERLSTPERWRAVRLPRLPPFPEPQS